MAFITCRDAAFGYDTGAVVSGLNFSVEPGDYLCVVGENGSGKSTLIKGLLRLKTPLAGEIHTGDGLRSDEIGYLPQQSAAQKDFPAGVMEVVLSGRQSKRGLLPFYSGLDRRTARENLERLGIGHLRKRCYRELSGGQQQRVLLARALCATEKLLLLDEPVAGLDPLVTKELYELISMLNREQGLTVIMVSHDIRSAMEYATHILHLGNRQLFFGRTVDYRKTEYANSFLGVNRVLDILSEMFSYTFLVRAVVVGLLVSLCASLLGVSLVLKRYSMIGDGLSHVGFGALAIATAMNMAPLKVSIPVVVLAAFLLLRIGENSKIKGDAAIALISTSALALGVIVISVTTGMNTDVCNYMFGSILAMSHEDVQWSIVLSVVVIILYVLFYSKIFAVTFDETFSRAVGTKAGLYNMLLAILTAVTIVLGMRMMGAMLISALIIFPALTSMRVCKRFQSVIICSALVSVVCFFIGVFLSYWFSLPTGASVVAVNVIMFALFSATGCLKGDWQRA